MTEQEYICLLWGWSEEELVKRVGPGPYVIYGGGDPPPEGYTTGGILNIHDPALRFNCIRVAGSLTQQH